MIETVYFDEDLKGDRMLITSHIIAFKGLHFGTDMIDGLSSFSHREFVNAIPRSASYRLSVFHGEKVITIDCAGWFWFGEKDYQRLCAATWTAVGTRLVAEALQRLTSGGQLTFSSGGGLEKRTAVTIARRGIHVQQAGLILKKDLEIEWQHLKAVVSNGSYFLTNYATKKTVAFSLANMKNNIIFSSVIGMLLDKAAYRTFFSYLDLPVSKLS